MRCSHGFELTVVDCPMRCGPPRSVRQAHHADPRLELLIQEVAIEFGLTREQLQDATGSYERGSVSTCLKARAALANRARLRFSISASAVARALGLTPKSLFYALQRCA